MGPLTLSFLYPYGLCFSLIWSHLSWEKVWPEIISFCWIPLRWDLKYMVGISTGPGAPQIFQLGFLLASTYIHSHVIIVFHIKHLFEWFICDVLKYCDVLPPPSVTSPTPSSVISGLICIMKQEKDVEKSTQLKPPLKAQPKNPVL